MQPVAMILAAGRGERMRPLTDATPKPLLLAGGKSLIQWQVERLVAAGISNIVINHAWLGAQIEAALGDGARFGAAIRYSAEGEALETVGGIVKAMPLLGRRPFIVTSGDVYTDFPYASLIERIDEIDRRYPERVGHLVMVDNPPFHPEGDMAVNQGLAAMEGRKLNYAGIGIYHPRLFDVFDVGVKAKLFPWAFDFVRQGKVSAEHYRGRWENIGTPAQLAALDRSLDPGTGG
jgi:MurNAc alpha-1-phosphate uridylyltransferase